MGLFAINPIKECPHCVLNDAITPVSAFKDVKLTDPCHECGNK